MASILDRYGIKEVCDVTFYELDNSGMPTNPVLYLDTLKVSTVEQTAENTEARGGKGNTALISWDYNKEINVTLEDALFSAKSMAIMFGNGQVYSYGDADNTSPTDTYIMKTETFTAASTATAGSTAATDISTAAISAGWGTQYAGPDGKLYNKVNPKFYDATGATVSKFEEKKTYFCSFDLVTINGGIIEISANTFPGTYYITGDTFARSEASGKDEFFQFIIPKAKVTAENTITMEAEGDPSVFNMNLRVLRPADGKMMKLVKYDLYGGTDPAAGDVSLIHNHVLNVNNMPQG